MQNLNFKWLCNRKIIYKKPLNPRPPERPPNVSEPSIAPNFSAPFGTHALLFWNVNTELVPEHMNTKI